MARYFLKFRHSDTGLTPTFTTFKKVSDLSVVTPPTPVVEVGFGEYYFDYVPTFDITFEVDGGASIPTEEVRYIADTISPRDIYLDEPISQVKDDVWNDTVDRAVSTKGDFVEHVGINTDAVNAATVFGQIYKARDVVLGGTGFGGTGVDVKTAKEAVMGVDARSLTDVAGTGFVSGTDSLKILSDVLDDMKGAGFSTVTDSLKVISDNVDTINTATGAANVANAVWDDVVNRAPGTKGDFVESISAGLSQAQVATAVWDAATASHLVPGTFGVRAASQAMTTDVTAARDLIKGGFPGVDLTQIGGAGFTSATMSLAASNAIMLRVAGMLHENSVLDGAQFDGNNNLTSARLRLYDSKANADAAVAIPWPGVYNTGKIAEYIIVATYTGSNLQTYEVSKVP